MQNFWAQIVHNYVQIYNMYIYVEFFKFVGRKGYIFIDALTHLQNYMVNVVDVLNVHYRKTCM